MFSIEKMYILLNQISTDNTLLRKMLNFEVSGLLRENFKSIYVMLVWNTIHRPRHYLKNNVEHHFSKIILQFF